MIKLEITEWERTEEFLIYKNSIIVGSHQSCDLILMDKSLEKKLLTLTIESDSKLVIDPHQVSGLNVNGLPLSGQSLLNLGDVLKIAQTEIKLIAFSLQNPFIRSPSELEQEIENFSKENPLLANAVKYLDKVSRDV